VKSGKNRLFIPRTERDGALQEISHRQEAVVVIRDRPKPGPPFDTGQPDWMLKFVEGVVVWMLCEKFMKVVESLADSLAVE
jgi:hypothetical protein